jgi:hypothetical protein
MVRSSIIDSVQCSRLSLTASATQIAFVNLVNNAGVSGEELGMLYINSLGKKAEAILTDPNDSALWSTKYWLDLVTDYSTMRVSMIGVITLSADTITAMESWTPIQWQQV